MPKREPPGQQRLRDLRHQQGGDDDDGDLPGSQTYTGAAIEPCTATVTGPTAE